MALPVQGDPAPWGTDLRNYILAVESAAAIKALTSYKVADQTFTSAVLGDVTNMGIALAATTTYDFEFYLPYTGNTNSSAPLTLSLAGPTNTFLGYSIVIQSSSSSRTESAKTAFASSFAGAAITTAGTTYVARIKGRVTTTASGTLIPQAASDGTRTNDLKIGGWGAAWLVT